MFKPFALRGFEKGCSRLTAVPPAVARTMRGALKWQLMYSSKSLRVSVLENTKNEKDILGAFHLVCLCGYIESEKSIFNLISNFESLQYDSRFCLVTCLLVCFDLNNYVRNGN